MRAPLADRSFPGARVWAVLGACVTATSLAAAEPSAADRETARKLLEIGDAKMAAKAFGEAKTSIEAAHRILRDPVTGHALAKVERALGRHVEARAQCREVERMPAAPPEPKPVVAAREACREIVREEDLYVATVRIVVRGASASATTLTVDGVALPPGAMDAPFAVNPGRRTFVASARGFVPHRIELDVPPGAEVPATFQLKPDGAPPGDASAETSAPPPPTAPPPTATTASRGVPGLAIVGFGVAATGLVVSGVAGLFAFQKASAAKDGCVDHVCPKANEADRDASRTWGTISTVGFVVGVAGAGVGTWALLSRRDETKTSLRVGPGSVVVRGSF